MTFLSIFNWKDSQSGNDFSYNRGSKKKNRLSLNEHKLSKYMVNNHECNLFLFQQDIKFIKYL